MLFNVIYTVSIILISAFCFFAYKTHQLSVENTLRKCVAWCVTDDSRLYRANLDLIDYLYKVQHCSKSRSSDYLFRNADKLFLIEEKYWLNGDDERSTAKEILFAYQKEMIQLYFSGKLIVSSSIFKLSDAEYFLLTLKEFLGKHECEKTFLGKEMYKTKEYIDRGSYGMPLFDATYELKDYAVVYQKMYLIAQMYCLTLRKNPFDTDTVSFQSVEHTKKVLDTKEMRVSRY